MNPPKNTKTPNRSLAATNNPSSRLEESQSHERRLKSSSGIKVLLGCVCCGLLATSVSAQSSTPAISFKSAKYVADQSAENVEVVLTCAPHTGEVSVALSTKDGFSNNMPPISAALAGTDYTAISNKVITFAADITEIKQVVSLTKKTGKVSNRQFSVDLANPVGAVLGSTTSAAVLIAASDSVKPTLTVSTPTDKAKVSAASPYSVTGVAGDANGIDRVEVVLNNGAPVLATLSSKAKTTTSVPWTVDVNPTEGLSNSLTVTAYDLHGNKTEVKRTFAFTRRYKMTVTRLAPSPAAVAGSTIALSAKTSNSTSLLAPASSSGKAQVSQVVVGSIIRLKATPFKGHVFSHWTLPAQQPSDIVNLGNEISFKMPANDVEVSASFLTAADIFVSKDNKGNSFYGLLAPQGTTAVSNSSIGFFSGAITPTTGAFTGKLILAGVTTPVTGTFYGNGSMVFKQGSKTSSTLKINETRSLTMSYGTNGITVNVYEGASLVASGLAARAYYDGKASKVAAGMLSRSTTSKTTPTKGIFNVALPAIAQNPVMDAHNYPQGTGVGTLTLSNNGTVIFAGTLADGSPFTASSALVTVSKYPFHAQLVTPGGKTSDKGGSLSGEMTVDQSQTNSDVLGQGLTWIRPKVTELNTSTPAALATQIYSDGWPSGIKIDAVGTFYDKTSTIQSTLGLLAGSSATNNAQLIFASSKLPATLTFKDFAIVKNTITKTTKTDKTTVLTASASTGQFSGSFKANWDGFVKAPLFKGILLDKGIYKGGYGFFISNKKDDKNPESGSVTLGKLPTL